MELTTLHCVRTARANCGSATALFSESVSFDRWREQSRVVRMSAAKKQKMGDEAAEPPAALLPRLSSGPLSELPDELLEHIYG